MWVVEIYLSQIKIKKAKLDNEINKLLVNSKKNIMAYILNS